MTFSDLNASAVPPIRSSWEAKAGLTSQKVTLSDLTDQKTLSTHSLSTRKASVSMTPRTAGSGNVTFWESYEC